MDFDLGWTPAHYTRRRVASRGRNCHVTTESSIVESISTYVTSSSCVAEGVCSYLADVVDVIRRLPIDRVGQVIHRLEEARWKQQTVFTCGNGGSAATSIHFASDLCKGAMVPSKPPFKSRSLCENIALVTAWSNDESYDQIFVQSMVAWISPGDVLVAISGSGNSRNVLLAVDAAAASGATTIGFTGFDGGELKDMADICITVPCHCMEQVEDVHLLLCHLITKCLRTTTLERICSE